LAVIFNCCQARCIFMLARELALVHSDLTLVQVQCRQDSCRQLFESSGPMRLKTFFAFTKTGWEAQEAYNFRFQPIGARFARLGG
jgi:hypothetical protein